MSEPQSAEEAYLAVEVADHEEDGPRYVEDYEGTWFVRGWNAAIEADRSLRDEVERIVGNGPDWARQFAYDVLRAALDSSTGDRPSTELDVERLAQAMALVTMLGHTPETAIEHAESYRKDAERVAAAYARLALTEGSEP